MPPAPIVRLPWVDHLRTFVIVLVVNLHACVSYSHVGDWYFMSEREPTLAAKVPFIVWEGYLQSFFMGLLFFISGYFAHGSLARRGPRRFTRERLLRLGLPALFYMLVIHPFILVILNPWNAKFGSPGAFYLNYISSGRFLSSTGPLWFAVALLILCLLLAGSRLAWRRPLVGERDESASQPAAGATVAAPGVSFLWTFALALSLGTFAVRLIQPIGTNVLNMQLCFFPQYVAFFICGLHAARYGWLLPLAASSLARAAGWIALLGGPAVLLTLMLLGMQNGKVEYFFGGWHWQALGFALWEQFAGVGLSLGALAFFSRKLDFENALMRWLAERSFAVYVLHAPVLVALAMFFRALPQNMYGLAALLTATGLLASYIVADFIRRIPVFRTFL
ncbi:MAG: acyltransferase family protein [Verrucomicrobia bacterium]|nr:acyltransferase family protein [Verrucomicrobiota bacterium]